MLLLTVVTCELCCEHSPSYSFYKHNWVTLMVANITWVHLVLGSSGIPMTDKLRSKSTMRELLSLHV